MNYLQLCQRASSEFGMSGAGPSSVLSQTGEYARLVRWIATAWEDLQLERPNWFWMRGSFSFTVTPGDRQYSAADVGIASRFGLWDINSLRIYRVSQNDELPLTFMSYEDFRAAYIIGPQTQSQPLYFTFDPALNLLLGPTPEYAYTVSGEYFKSVQTLAADADTPEMPSQFHLAILYRAMQLYGRYEGAPELVQDGAFNYRRMLRFIELNQMSTVNTAGPLA